jgi:hypothetical protein
MLSLFLSILAHGGNMAELKRFFEGGGGRKVSSSELIEFKRSCKNEAEYDAYVAEAKAENERLGY